MAVAYGSSTVSARGTSAAQATGSITVSGANPVLLIGAAIDISGGNPTINSVTFGGTGTPVLVIDTANGANVRTIVYAVPAPSGSGVVTLNLSGSKPVQISVSLFTGAHQTTPCPTGDAVGSTSGASPITVTALNYATGDGAYGVQGHVINQDCFAVTPNQTVSDSTTNVNMQGGYSLTSGAVTYELTGASTCATNTVRIAQAAAFAPRGSTIVSQAVRRAAYYRAWPSDSELFDMVRSEHNGALRRRGRQGDGTQIRAVLGRRRRLAVSQLDCAGSR